MSWILTIAGCLLMGGLTGWILRARRSRPTVFQNEPAPSVTDMPRNESGGQDLQGVFGEIRTRLADHYDLLTGMLEKLSSPEVVEKVNHEKHGRLVSDVTQLTEKLALVYDDMRRFGDRLPVAQDARTDSETEAGNQRALEEWLQMHFAYLSRYGNEFSISLFEIDFDAEESELDRAIVLESVRSLYGLLTDSIRGTDKVFRYSTNEFVVVLPETSIEGALIFARRVTENAAEVMEQSVYGGVSAARHSDSLRTLMNRADAALYQAKSQAENGVCFHDGHRIGSSAETPNESVEVGA